MKVVDSTKRSLKYALILLILQMNLIFIYSDLPVHCKREEIEGVWTFRIGSETFDASLNNPKTHCGHGFPDKIEKTVGDTNFRFNSYKDVELVLAKDYKIYDNLDSNKEVGHWTPVYDEAFVAYYQNSVFTAFLKYYLTDPSRTTTKDYTSNCDKTMIGWYIPDSTENNKNWSCFFGFKSKVKNEFTPNRFLQIPFKTQKKNRQDKSHSNFIEMTMTSQAKAQLNLQMMKYDQTELVKELNSMNLSWKADVHSEFKGLSFFQLKEKLGLKRDSRKTHKNKYNDDSNFDDMQIFDNSNLPPQYENSSDFDNFDTYSHLEISSTKKHSYKNRNKNFIEPPGTNLLENIDIFDNGMNSSGKQRKTEYNGSLENMSNFNIFDNTESNHKNNYNSSNNKNIDNKVQTEYHHGQVENDSFVVNDPTIIQKYIHKELNEIDVNSLAKNWDWRNVGGANFVPRLRRQYNCGSCYVFSLMSSLESRLRILTNNKDKTEFSRQFPLGCSFYTEGCSGGYPFLVAKFLHEFEVIPETCAPYEPNNVQCGNFCDYSKNPIKYSVTKYEYIGGFYGATNEIDLIKEIRARGPIPGNMSVPWTFSYYKKGIYSENSLSKNSGKFSKATLFDKNLSWSNVDHSILLVGYGEENGIKYWIGMNTWGEQWGENGYFRILRGENNCNIETMGDAARISFKPRF